MTVQDEDDQGPLHDPATPSIMQFEIINHNNFTIPDHFDGVPIRFPPNEVVTVSPDVALHCFGYPGEFLDRAAHMAKRYGWSSRDFLRPEGPADSQPRYVILAGNVEIRPVYYELVRRNPDAPIPADDGREPDTPREPVSAGADAGETKVGKRTKTPAKLGGSRQTRGRQPAAANKRPSRSR